MDNYKQNALLGDVIAIAHQAAVEKKYVVSKEAVTYLDGLLKSGGRTSQLVRSPFDIGKQFEEMHRKIKGTKDDTEINNISRLCALDIIAANAVTAAVRADQTPTAETQITEYLSKSFKRADKDQKVQAIEQALDKIVISLVHTMHPTIYHTPEARRFEKRLIEILEKPENKILDGMRLSKFGEQEVRALFNEENGDPNKGFIESLAKGTTNITPKRPMTVALETQTEQENFDSIRKELKEVVAAWNKAIAAPALGLSDEQKTKLTISPERKKRIIELRTWGQSADADGRDKATSQFLYECIQKNSESGDYKGPILDFRQNAEIHRDFISSLIQVKFRNSNSKPGRYHESSEGKNSFQQFCKEFMDKRADDYNKRKHGEDSMGWDGPEKSIFQQLDSHDRMAFISELISSGHNLIPTKFAQDVREFNQHIFPIKKAFLEQHKESILAKGYNPETISYEEMLHVSIPYEGTQVSLRALWNAKIESEGWTLPQGELQYHRLSTSAHPPAQELLVMNFLQGTRKMVKNGSEWEQNDLTATERATCMDTAKRMTVIGDAIDKFGDKVAKRYEIANFSEPADFLIAVKLFQDSGLAKIENGKVKSTKLGIMPLLETEDDLHAAKDIFETLLANPISRSFWEARGKAEIMLGFSDGAASAGNFASQWEIYKASRELAELFARHGIEVEFFQGRGRGTDRGGTVDPSLQFALMPPEAMCHGRYDVTIQSDLPMDLAASKKYGQDYFTKILLSTVDAYVNGEVTRQKLADMKGKPDVASQRDEREAGIDTIARRCSEIYNKMVRKNPGAIAYFNDASDNPHRSSRSTARGGVTLFKNFDTVRAIPKEYLFNGADLPVHNAGSNTALVEFEKGHDTKALSALLEHPFVNAVTQTIRAGIEHLEPTVAMYHARANDVYAKSKGRPALSEQFVKDLLPELTPLKDTLDRITGRNTNKAKTPEEKNCKILDRMAHAIITASVESGKDARPNINRPDLAQWRDTLYNSLFVTAQDVKDRVLQPSRGLSRAA